YRRQAKSSPNQIIYPSQERHSPEKITNQPDPSRRNTADYPLTTNTRTLCAERVMASLRLASHRVPSCLPCCRCRSTGQRWDLIAGKPYCPNCQEALALGEAPPLRERTHSAHCSICDRAGSVRFHTFPLQAATPVEIDLCPEHLRGLLGRRLSPQAFQRLDCQLSALGLRVEEIFLLHDAFYDLQGRALQPAGEFD